MAIDPRVDIGHVHLKVADLERALGFYCGVLGFELQQRMGDQAAFISAGGYHHHLGLNTWESKGGSPPPPGTTGLFHTAIRYPDRATLADALRRLRRGGHPIDGATDHGVSEAIYLRDPDENGVELYRDRPEEEWPRSPDGDDHDVQRAARPRGAARGRAVGDADHAASASATQRIGSPLPRSGTPASISAPQTSVRRCAANVRTWAIIPP